MNRLHEAIRRLPAGVEFLVVVTWAFGLPIFASIMSLAAPNDVRSPVFTNAELFAAIIFEVFDVLIRAQKLVRAIRRVQRILSAP